MSFHSYVYSLNAFLDETMPGIVLCAGDMVKNKLISALNELNSRGKKRAIKT